MVAIDTNLLVRLLTADHPAQYNASRKLFADEDIFISDSVLLETEWVLRAAFDLSPADVYQALRSVLGLANVHVGNTGMIARIIDWHEAAFDFSDAFHLATTQDQDCFKTFDSEFIKLAKRHTDRRVERPKFRLDPAHQLPV